MRVEPQPDRLSPIAERCARSLNPWPLVLGVVVAVLTAVFALTDLRSPVRPIVALAFLGVVPGTAFVGLLRERDLLAKIAVSIALSFAFATVVGEALILLGSWSPSTELGALIALSAIGVGLTQWQNRRIGFVDAASEGHAAPTVPRTLLSRRLVTGSQTWWKAAHLAELVSALTLWALSLPVIEVARITDYGLVSALPWTFYAALGLVTMSFCVAVFNSRTSTALLAAHVVVLIVILHATLPLVYESPRYAYVYKHIGVVDYLLRHGGFDRSVDIYHNWPGFFVLGALFTELAGFSKATSYVAWSQPFFNLLSLAALVFIFQALTLDRRLIWLSCWFFFATNWIGQDYFSPQAVTFFGYLVTIGLCLKWLRITSASPTARREPWQLVRPLVKAYRWIVDQRARESSTTVVPSRDQRVVALAIALVVFMGIVISHQLTPWMTIAGVTSLVVFRRCRPRTLPVVMILLAVGWMMLAYPFLTRVQVFESAGDLGQNVQLVDLSNLGEGRVFVAVTSRALTIGMWLLGGWGMLRRLRHGYWDLAGGLLALSPLPTVVAESYGGEILLRVFLFSLPWMAFFAAAGFCTRRDLAGSWKRVTAVFVTSNLLLGSLLITYYGLERANLMRLGEVEAAQYFYHTIPPGSFLMLVAANFPTRLEGNYHRYLEFHYDPSLLQQERFQGRMLGASDVDAVADELSSYSNSYLMFSKSQVAYAELFDLTPPGAIESLRQAVLASRRFRVAYHNDDAVLLQLHHE